MRSVVQRVHSAEVKVGGEVVGSIEKGLIVFLGVGKKDSEKDVEWMCEKILNLRIFEDESGKMNRNVIHIKGGILIISQFTLYGDCRRGRRPSFSDAAPPEYGKYLYKKFVEMVREKVQNVSEGIFGAHMDIKVINDGPVTLLLDSERRF